MDRTRRTLTSDAFARLTATETDNAERRRLLGEIWRRLRRFVMGTRATKRWAQDTLLDRAPRLPIRLLKPELTKALATESLHRGQG